MHPTTGAAELIARSMQQLHVRYSCVSVSRPDPVSGVRHLLSTLATAEAGRRDDLDCRILCLIKHQIADERCGQRRKEYSVPKVTRGVDKPRHVRGRSDDRQVIWRARAETNAHLLEPRLRRLWHQLARHVDELLHAGHGGALVEPNLLHRRSGKDRAICPWNQVHRSAHTTRLNEAPGHPRCNNCPRTGRTGTG